MKALFFAILAGITVGSELVLRRMVMRTQTIDPLVALAVQFFSALPVFLLIMFTTGKWRLLVELDCRSTVILATAGILSYVIFVFLILCAFRYGQANFVVPTYTAIGIIVAVSLGIVILKEPLTSIRGIGILITILGIFLVAVNR